jgi:acetyl-CoA C-acetyltransferase
MVHAALAKVPELDPNEIDDLILGCGQPAGEAGNNLGRAVSVFAGFDRVPGVPVNRYWSSSLQTTRMALHTIKAGEGDVFISAGVESISRSNLSAWADTPQGWHPKVTGAPQARTAEFAAGGQVWSDPRAEGLLPDVYIAMGQTAENVAQTKGVSREDQDAFGVRSQNLTEQRIAEGFWEREITPVTLPDGTVVSADDGPRAGVTLEGVQGLKPAFRPDGLVTAGNCCPLNDGAAALVIMSDTKARELGITPLARIVSTGLSGLSPEIMGYGPVEASRRALAIRGLAPQLEPRLEEHAQPAGAHRVAEALEPPVGVDRQVAMEPCLLVLNGVQGVLANV